MKWLRAIEFVLVAAGLMLIAIYIAASVHSNISSGAATRAFRVAQGSMANRLNNTPGSIKLQSKVDFSLWSVEQTTAYEQSLTHYSGGPLAGLGIPKLQLEVPVFDGTDDLTLNRGVGRIRGPAQAGEKGNIGIAGHRDGFFRGLKDIDVGDGRCQSFWRRAVRPTVLRGNPWTRRDKLKLPTNFAPASQRLLRNILPLQSQRLYRLPSSLGISKPAALLNCKN